MSGLGGSVLSDWGGSVKIGGKCQDWGAPVGGKLSGLGLTTRIVLGLGVCCQDWGHKTPNSDMQRHARDRNPVYV